MPEWEWEGQGRGGGPGRGQECQGGGRRARVEVRVPGWECQGLMKPSSVRPEESRAAQPYKKG